MKKKIIMTAVLLCLCLAAVCLVICVVAAKKPVRNDPQTEGSTQSAPSASEPTPDPETQGENRETEAPKSETLPQEEPTTLPEDDPETQPQEEPATQPQEEPDKPDIPSPSVCGKLSVVGTQLVDKNGEAVQLRGLSTHGLSFYPQYVNEALFGELRREWKANVIRLAMYTAESGGYCTGGDKEKLKDLVRSGVEYATKQDMYVIVDWHILSDGNPNRYKAEAIDFFAQMSKEFAGYENVIYEICNEPNGGTSWQDIKSYAQAVIPVIRANAPDALILVGTPNWSQYVNEAAADPITGYGNILYTLHFYAATHREDLRNTMTAAINAGLPVFVSEFGICDASGNGGIDEAQANAWVQVMDRYKISYVAWNISNKNETSAILKSTVSKTSGFAEADLSASGKWLYHTLTGGTLPPDSGAEQTVPGVGKDPTVPGESKDPVIQCGDVAVTAVLVNSWEANGQHFYQYTLTVTNNTGLPCESWKAELRFSGEISLSDGWNGQYSVQADTLHISSMDYNGRLPAGGSAGDVGFIICGAAGLTLSE